MIDTFAAVVLGVPAAAAVVSDGLHSPEPVPGAQDFDVPGAQDFDVPDVQDSAAPGALQSAVPGVLQSAAPGALQSAAPGALQSAAPGVQGCVEPVVGGQTSAGWWLVVVQQPGAELTGWLELSLQPWVIHIQSPPQKWTESLPSLMPNQLPRRIMFTITPTQLRMSYEVH